jgi:glutamate/tyrosine decarboxylase-like PLP-dependent enzyme
MIAGDIRLARALADAVARTPDLELLTQSLSITTFRFVPGDLRARVPADPAVSDYLDTLNRELLDEIQRSGQAFISNAIVRGVYLLRSCIVNLHTTEADIDALPEIVATLGRAADSRLRPRGLDAEREVV